MDFLVFFISSVVTLFSVIGTVFFICSGAFMCLESLKGRDSWKFFVIGVLLMILGCLIFSVGTYALNRLQALGGTA